MPMASLLSLPSHIVTSVTGSCRGLVVLKLYTLELRVLVLSWRSEVREMNSLQVSDYKQDEYTMYNMD